MIKLLTPQDFPEAVRVIRAAFLTVADTFGLTESNCPKHVAFATDIGRLNTHRDWGWLMYGLYDDGQMVGYVAVCKEYNADRNHYEIHNLSVLPEHRHKGHGKTLLDFCKEKVRELRGYKVNIEIIEENTVVKNWYATNGFIHIKTAKHENFPFTIGYMEYEV
jgi:ribosomal protein S18 acetylase RimI-like enzyme